MFTKRQDDTGINLSNTTQRWIAQRSFAWLVSMWILGYLVLVVLFALAYAAAGHLADSGVVSDNGGSVAYHKGFAELVYFSLITIATVGYGDLAPVGVARVVACIQVAGGFLYTGVGIAVLAFRLLRPQGTIRFARHAVFCPETATLTVRAVNINASSLANVRVSMWLWRKRRPGWPYRHHELSVRTPHVLYMRPRDPWNFIHETTEPAKRGNKRVDFSLDTIESTDRLAVLIEGFDEGTQSGVAAYAVYHPTEMVCGRFARTRPSEDNVGLLRDLAAFERVGACKSCSECPRLGAQP